MSTYVIGDIHGCSKALKELLGWLDPRRTDTIITLGDYIDRGPNSKKVIQLLIDLSKRTRLIPLKGNHELIMESAKKDPEAREWWMGVGGVTTLESYGDGNIKSIPDSHWKFIKNGLWSFEDEKFIYVHGGVIPHIPVKDQHIEDLAWIRVYGAKPHRSGKTVICGHTPQSNFKPLDLGHTICIDTDPARGGWLTALNPENGRIFQTRENGKRNSGSLSSL